MAARRPRRLTGRFVYNTPGGDLWVMDADGSDCRQLTRSGDGLDYNPTWSPDGRQIGFRTTRGESPPGVDPSDIFVVNADGSGQRELTTPENSQSGLFPAWSPDGRRIVFGRGCGGGGDCDLYVMNADGSGVRQLTDDPGAETANAWLPDGRLLVGIWAPGQEGPPAWVLMDGDGGDRRELPQLAQAMDPVDYLPSP